MAKARKMNSAEAQLDMQEQIRQRAYQLYQERGENHGNDVEDWLTAEREIRGSQTNKAAA